jgi:hypothetical protein
MIMAAQFYTCEVRRAGASDDGDVYIHLKRRPGRGTTFDWWFKAAPSKRREMLATALTAITTGLRVDAYLDDTNQYETIQRLYIIRD